MDTFHILALDGGGTRGIYTAQFLAKIEQALQRPIKTCFDLIAGTSTGAIIAGAAVSDIPMQDIVELFETETPHIFRRRWYRIPLFLSKYPSKRLAQILAAHLPATSLNEIETPLMITSSEISKSEIHIFRSNYGSRDSEIAPADKEVSLRDAVLASCAAPTFFAPKSLDNSLLADGGLWANNPSTIALVEALSTFEKDTREIRMLSLGTGHSVNMYRDRRGWGVPYRVGRCEVDFLRNDPAIAGICKYGPTAAEAELPTHQRRNRFLGIGYPYAVRQPQGSCRA